MTNITLETSEKFIRRRPKIPNKTNLTPFSLSNNTYTIKQPHPNRAMNWISENIEIIHLISRTSVRTILHINHILCKFFLSTRSRSLLPLLLLLQTQQKYGKTLGNRKKIVNIKPQKKRRQQTHPEDTILQWICSVSRRIKDIKFTLIWRLTGYIIIFAQLFE